MDDLFAMEDLSQLEDEEQINTTQNIVLTESRSYEDPVLLKDDRVLANILDRQLNNNNNTEGYFKTVQTEIKPHMRKIVSDWMLQVTEEQQCQSEVFSLAINYMDRFLSRVNIRKNQFQLLASVCMFLASKFKETAPLPAENLVIYTDNSITTLEITQWELLVLEVLNWDLSAVTPYSILDHLLRNMELDLDSSIVRRHAETFLALAATEHSFCHMSPATIAAACLGSALHGLKSKGVDETMDKVQQLTQVEKNHIKDCMSQIEVSIGLSMTGVSFQPSQQSNSSSSVNCSEGSKVIIPQQPGYYAQSTTPTDMMEISSTCVY